MAKYSNTLRSNSTIRKFPIPQIYVYLSETDLIIGTWANDHLIFSAIICITRVVESWSDILARVSDNVHGKYFTFLFIGMSDFS